MLTEAKPVVEGGHIPRPVSSADLDANPRHQTRTADPRKCDEAIVGSETGNEVIGCVPLHQLEAACPGSDLLHPDEPFSILGHPRFLRRQLHDHETCARSQGLQITSSAHF